jgi:hypothetical protein
VLLLVLEAGGLGQALHLQPLSCLQEGGQLVLTNAASYLRNSNRVLNVQLVLWIRIRLKVISRIRIRIRIRVRIRIKVIRIRNTVLFNCH